MMVDLQIPNNIGQFSSDAIDPHSHACLKQTPDGCFCPTFKSDNSIKFIHHSVINSHCLVG